MIWFCFVGRWLVVFRSLVKANKQHDSEAGSVVFSFLHYYNILLLTKLLHFRVVNLNNDLICVDLRTHLCYNTVEFFVTFNVEIITV